MKAHAAVTTDGGLIRHARLAPAREAALRARHGLDDVYRASFEMQPAPRVWVWSRAAPERPLAVRSHAGANALLAALVAVIADRNGSDLSAFVMLMPEEIAVIDLGSVTRVEQGWLESDGRRVVQAHFRDTEDTAAYAIRDSPGDRGPHALQTSFQAFSARLPPRRG
jgi:hypothetical protein